MVLIWGRKGFQQHLGFIVLECPRCMEYRPFGVYQHGKKFTLYFIPTFSYDKKQVAICGSCSYAFEIPKNMKNELKSMLMSEEELMRKISEAQRMSEEKTKELSMKKCPYCAEEIKKEAILCRYCRKELPPSTSDKLPSSF